MLPLKKNIPSAAGLLIALAAIMTGYLAEAQMNMLFSTAECNQCIRDGHVACLTTDDVTQGMCCNPNGIDIEQCSATKDPVNFQFCTTDANDPAANHYACPFMEEVCFWQPCKGMVGNVDTDCTFDNRGILDACIEADKTERFQQPCQKGKDTYYSEGGGIDLSTIDFSIYTYEELLDLKRRYDAGEFDNYGAEEKLHPFLERCKKTCKQTEGPDITLDAGLNNYVAISGSGRQFSGETDCYFIAKGDVAQVRSKSYDYMLQLNITYMVGVQATIHNGTDRMNMGDAVQVDFDNGARNFSYQAELGNSLFVRFQVDPNYDGQSFFMAQFGMVSIRERNKGGGAQIEEPGEEYITYTYEVIPQSKELTFNEKVIFAGIILGVLLMWFNNFFPDAFKPCNYCWGFCKREKRTLDPLEAEFEFKVKQGKVGFEINVSSSSSEGESGDDEESEEEKEEEQLEKLTETSETEDLLQIDRIETEVELITYNKKVAGQRRKYGEKQLDLDPVTEFHDDLNMSQRSATIEPEDDTNMSAPQAFQRNLGNGGEKPPRHMMDSIDREIDGLDMNMTIQSKAPTEDRKEMFPGQELLMKRMEALKKKNELNEERLQEAKRANVQLSGALAQTRKGKSSASGMLGKDSKEQLHPQEVQGQKPVFTQSAREGTENDENLIDESEDERNIQVMAGPRQQEKQAPSSEEFTDRK